MIAKKTQKEGFCPPFYVIDQLLQRPDELDICNLA